MHRIVFGTFLKDLSQREKPILLQNIMYHILFVSKVQSFKLYNFEIVTVTLPISLTAAAALKNR